MNQNHKEMNSNSNVSTNIAKCEPYIGSACKDFLVNQNVYVEGNQKAIEEDLIQAFSVINLSPDLTKECRPFVYRSICYNILPTCENVSALPVPEHICKKDCEILENDICKTEYAIGRKEEHIRKVIKKEGCSEYPSTGCHSLGLPEPIPSNKNVTCYNNHGIDFDYVGEVSTSISNKTCHPWHSEMVTSGHVELYGGHNFCRNPNTNPEFQLPWCYTDEGKELCDIPKCDKPDLGTCEPYKGTACNDFLANENVFIESGQTQAQIEQDLAGAFRIIKASPDVSKECKPFVLPSMCYNILPRCRYNASGSPYPERICKEDCEILENDICKTEYAIGRNQDQISKVLKEEGCSGLPSYGCRNLHIPNPLRSDKSVTCYSGNGADYVGEISKSVSNKTCRPWHSVMKTGDHVELFGGHNFCRNPSTKLEFKQPWCYTENGKEICNIPKCDNIFVNPLFMGISLVSILSILIFSVLLCLCLKRKQQRRRRRKFLDDSLNTNVFNMSPCKRGIVKSRATSSDGSNSGGRRGEISSLLAPSHSASSSQKSERRGTVRVTEFKYSNIVFSEELGEGAFGKVYRGEVLLPSGDRMLVAIKTLKENANSKTVAEFKREVELMSELRHPNIICLLGACMNKRLCMLFEFMTYGDLHAYLNNHSPKQEVPQGYTETILSTDDLLDISIQIAAGMDYLCNQHFVHRDLATRNCLVGNNLIVKISDFGLSRDVYSSDYYRVQKSALLPIRWMSPESILYGKFTVESDIWSFGVVLWEIYSYGMQPYYAHNNKEVVGMIRSHQVLPCPEGCPSRTYALMIECWNQVPNRRPQFAEIHSRLVQWRNLYSTVNVGMGASHLIPTC